MYGRQAKVVLAPDVGPLDCSNQPSLLVFDFIHTVSFIDSFPSDYRSAHTDVVEHAIAPLSYILQWGFAHHVSA